MSAKSFDLNIEKILENWEIKHAIREVISNALDERLLTNTKSVIIEKRGESWFIRDFGRGIQYTHLTQNENQEKLDNSNVIGRFGIGLKDALATFERHGIAVQIKSKYGTIKTTKAVKHGFGDIVTLHALIEDPEDDKFIGTEFEMKGISELDIDDSKQLFLIFSNEKVIDSTRFGQVISRSTGPGAIYINGVKVAEETNFLFSYNITLLNAAIKKAINRERSHVGRTAYADSIKKILLSSVNSDVAAQLSEDISHFHEGTMHDELAWVDVQEHAVKILSSQGKVVIVTAQEAMSHPDLIDQARNNDLKIITIPENLRAKIANGVDLNGNRLVDLSKFSKDYNDSFIFDFVNISELSESERSIYDTVPFIVSTFGSQPEKVKQILISNTMRPDLMSSTQTVGCWDPNTNSIVVSRGQLKSMSSFSGTLIHELVHAKTGYSDVTRDFETALTVVIGEICTQLIITKKTNEAQASKILPNKVEMKVQEPVKLVEQSTSSDVTKLQAEKAQTEQRLRDAQGILAKLHESEKLERLKSAKLTADLKKTQELLAQAKASTQQLSQKAWYKFW